MDNNVPTTDVENLLTLLKEEQEKSGFISQGYIEQVAQMTGLSIGEVYGVVTFYHFLSIQPMGRNVIRVCKSIPCYLRSSQLVVDAIQSVLGIAPGETTPDGKFSLQLTNCIGGCDHSPAMLLNHEFHGNLDPVRIAQILDACP